MKVKIRTRRIAPVGFAGAKLRANGRGRQVTIGYPYELRQGEDAHGYAARLLAEKLGIGAGAALTVTGTAPGGFMFTIETEG